MVIACGVFNDELTAVLSTVPDSIACSVRWLEQGLHRTPHLLNTLIREEVDRIDSEGEALDSILLAYGLCSHGLAGISSKRYQIVVPRAHDCITLFLGSKQRYHDEFSHAPGTYWFTPGFISGTVQPGQSEKYAGIFQEYEKQYEQYLDRYGDHEIAAYIVAHQEQAWIARYTRGAYVQSGLDGGETLKQKARAYCQERGWTFAEIPGDLTLLSDLVSGNWDDERFLIVPPGETITAGSVDEVITCASKHRGDSATGGSFERCYRFDGEYYTCSESETVEDIGSVDTVIGIDAGGTFTDAVAVSLADNMVLAAGKAPTTYHDLSIGIREALLNIPKSIRNHAERIALSTTLATNAIVEETGSRTGLILIGYPPETAALVPIGAGDVKVVVTGRHDIDGTETEPLDTQALSDAADSLVRKGVEAFAVSSYLSPRNPDHELRSREVLSTRYDIPVVLGHSVTGDLDAARRATTTLLNARLTPVIKHLINAVEGIVKDLGLPPDIRLVTTDATLMNAKEARLSPVRMVLSGPAASVMGARFLCQADTAIVVDTGGTTTDIAIIENGSARRTNRGANIGKYRTSITATDIRTIGLGGDSWIRWVGNTVSIGPERVIPISVLAAKYPEVTDRLGALQDYEGMDYGLVQPAIFYVLKRATEVDRYSTDHERTVVSMLADGPLAAVDIAAKLSYPYVSLLGLERLETLGIVIKSGFTPTDMIVALGNHELGDRSAALLMHKHYVNRSGRSLEQLTHDIWHAIHRKAAAAILTEAVPENDPDKTFPGCGYCTALFGEDTLVTARYRLNAPVIGIGAPSREILSDMNSFLEADVIVSDHAAVANAVGAAVCTGGTHIDMMIATAEQNGYILYAPDGKRTYRSLDQAKQEAVNAARVCARKYANSMGYDQFTLRVSVTDRHAPTALGTLLHIDTSVVAHLAY